MAPYYTDGPRRVLQAGTRVCERSDPASSALRVVAARRVGDAAAHRGSGRFGSARVVVGRHRGSPPRRCCGWRGPPACSRRSRRVRRHSPRCASSRPRSSSSPCSPRSTARRRPAAVSARCVATLVCSVLASGHDIASAAANALAYGDEQRFPFRVPPALFLGPLPIARLLVAAGVVAARPAAGRRRHRARPRHAPDRRGARLRARSLVGIALARAGRCSYRPGSWSSTR